MLPPLLLLEEEELDELLLEEDELEELEVDEVLELEELLPVVLELLLEEPEASQTGVLMDETFE